MATTVTYVDDFASPLSQMAASFAEVERGELRAIHHDFAVLFTIAQAFNALAEELGRQDLTLHLEPCPLPPIKMNLIEELNTAIAQDNVMTNSLLSNALERVQDCACIEQLSSAQISALVPLLVAWLGDARVAPTQRSVMGFTLLHEIVRIHGAYLLGGSGGVSSSDPSARRQWRAAVAALDNLAEATSSSRPSAADASWGLDTNSIRQLSSVIREQAAV